MTQKLRASRVPAHHVAVYESGDRTTEVQVHDMSTSGVFVRSEALDPEGTKVRLQLRTYLSHEPVTVSARVARVGDAPCCGMGLAFTEPNEQGHEIVKRYCAGFEQDRRVVLVDDDKAVLRMMARVLYSRGAAFIGLELPIDSEYVITRFKPQVVLLDLMMPGMSGVELAQRLLQREDMRDIRLAFYTAASIDNLPPEVSEVPIIPKGCPLRELTAAIDDLLGRPQLPV